MCSCLSLGLFTREAMDNIVDTTLKNAADFFNGRELANEVKA